MTCVIRRTSETRSAKVSVTLERDGTTSVIKSVPASVCENCGEASEQSDVDFLVDLEHGRSLLDLGGLLMDLKDLLGRDVDVVTEEGIYWLLRRRILKEARSL